MDWSNCFTFEGFIVSYSSFQMAWEVVEEAKSSSKFHKIMLIKKQCEFKTITN